MPPAVQSEKKDLHIDQIKIGTEIIDRVIRWLSPFIVILIAVILGRAIRLGSLVSSSIQVVLLIFTVFVAFGHQRFKPDQRIYFYIFSAAVIGVIGTYHWGLMGSGHAAVLLSMVFASILGMRRFLIILCMLVAAKISVALVWIFSKPEIPFDISLLMYSPAAWGLTLLGAIAAGCAALVWEGTYRRLSTVTEELRESEHRYKEIFNATNDALIIFDETGRMVDANKATYKLFGIEPQKNLKYTMSDLSFGEHPYSEAEMKERMVKALDSIPQIFEWQSRKLDGQVIWSEVALRGTRIRGNSRLIASVRDSTERKKTEEEMGRLYNELAQAQKIETVGRLAGGVAHDFNNMLSVILGHAELALELTSPREVTYSSLKEIQNAANRSAKLTRQLLAYARRQTISPKTLKLNETLADMIAMLQRIIGETVDVIWLPGEDLWPVKVDPSQLDQVLSNLCVNARDAIQKDGTITIHTKNIILDDQQFRKIHDCEPGAYVMLSVKDDGVGMTTETMKKAFEPFFTTKKLGEGTGLGLSTVYGIVKQNKGFIQVKSEPGKGACFKIYFPRYQGMEEKAVPKPVQESVTYGQERSFLLKMSYPY